MPYDGGDSFETKSEGWDGGRGLRGLNVFTGVDRLPGSGRVWCTKSRKKKKKLPFITGKTKSTLLFRKIFFFCGFGGIVLVPPWSHHLLAGISDHDARGLLPWVPSANWRPVASSSSGCVAAVMASPSPDARSGVTSCG